MGNRRIAARAALAILAFGGITVAAADRVTAKERSTGCKVGAIKSVSELDERVAACTLAIDTSRSPAQLTLALSYRGQALLHQNKCDLAIADLNRARDVSPSKKNYADYDVHLWLSYYWQNCKGDFDRGIAVLNEAAAILPRDPAVYNQRANMYRDKGDYGAAIADINRSIALINNDSYRASAYNNAGLGLTLERMGDFELKEATAGRQEPYTYGSLPGREDFFFVNK